VLEGSNDQIPAGWYPAPSGGQRYWDGQRWLALPNPENGHADGTVPYPPVSGRGLNKRVIFACAAAVIVLVVAGVGLVLKNRHDTDVNNAAIASTSSSKAAAAASSSAAAAARVQQETDAKRAERASAVTEIEASIKTMAEKQVADGLYDGPILSVSCDPLGGGSTDDLTAKTTVFDCFAATKDNGDGTMTGKKYHATMNWDTQNYTYGLGDAH
jgi:hypothetical protein